MLIADSREETFIQSVSQSINRDNFNCKNEPSCDYLVGCTTAKHSPALTGACTEPATRVTLPAHDASTVSCIYR